MAGTDYTCPSCGAWIGFNPDVQKFRCEYCLGEFTLEAVEAHAAGREENKDINAEPDDPSADVQGYTCQFCGAEAILPKGTTATVCHYCHKPIVLADQLEGAFRPEHIMPFQISQEKAMGTFLQWASGKKFAPKGFTDPNRIDEMKGVYLPFWWADFEADVQMVINGKTVHRTTENTRYRVETSVYEISRAGVVTLDRFGAVVLERYSEDFINGLGAFDLSREEAFAMPYLAGHVAESYDRSEEEVKQLLTQKAYDKIYQLVTYEEGLDEASVQSFQLDWTKIEWHYGLLPVWMMNYAFKDKIYQYGINGVSGQSFGEMPVDRVKMNLLAGGVGSAVFILMLLGGAFLW